MIFIYQDVQGRQSFSIRSDRIEGIDVSDIILERGGDGTVSLRGVSLCTQRTDHILDLFLSLFPLRYGSASISFGDITERICFEAFSKGRKGISLEFDEVSFLQLPYTQEVAESLRVFERVLSLSHNGEDSAINLEWGKSLRGVLEYLQINAWHFGEQVGNILRKESLVS